MQGSQRLSCMMALKALISHIHAHANLYMPHVYMPKK